MLCKPDILKIMKQKEEEVARKERLANDPKAAAAEAQAAKEEEKID